MIDPDILEDMKRSREARERAQASAPKPSFPGQDNRVSEALAEAIEVGLELLPIGEELRATAEVAIAFALRVALKRLGIATGKVIVTPGPDAKIKVRIS